MERRFVCSKEVTLSQQVADDEKYLISKILIEGRLCGSDLMLLSDMSKHGSLRQLDMHGVTELILMIWRKTVQWIVIPFMTMIGLKRSVCQM